MWCHFLFWISNEFIDFLESIWIFSIFFYVFKNENNVTNCKYIFVLRFQLLSKCTYNSCTVIASIFVRKRYFEKRKTKLKTSYGFWKTNKFIRNEERIGYLIIYY